MAKNNTTTKKASTQEANKGSFSSAEEARKALELNNTDSAPVTDSTSEAPLVSTMEDNGLNPEPEKQVKAIKIEGKRKTIKVPSAPSPKAVGYHNRMNLDEFRNLVVTLSDELVVKEFIKLLKNDKLVNNEACYDELVRLGYGSELRKAGVTLQ